MRYSTVVWMKCNLWEFLIYFLILLISSKDVGQAMDFNLYSSFNNQLENISNYAGSAVEKSTVKVMNEIYNKSAQLLLNYLRKSQDPDDSNFNTDERNIDFDRLMGIKRLNKVLSTYQDRGKRKNRTSLLLSTFKLPSSNSSLFEEPLSPLLSSSSSSLSPSSSLSSSILDEQQRRRVLYHPSSSIISSRYSSNLFNPMNGIKAEDMNFVENFHPSKEEERELSSILNETKNSDNDNGLYGNYKSKYSNENLNNEFLTNVGGLKSHGILHQFDNNDYENIGKNGLFPKLQNEFFNGNDRSLNSRVKKARGSRMIDMTTKQIPSSPSYPSIVAKMTHLGSLGGNPQYPRQSTFTGVPSSVSGTSTPLKQLTTSSMIANSNSLLPLDYNSIFGLSRLRQQIRSRLEMTTSTVAPNFVPPDPFPVQIPQLPLLTENDTLEQSLYTSTVTVAPFVEPTTESPKETGKIGEVLDLVLKKLESLRDCKSKNSEPIPEGFPCNLNGSWNSEVTGLKFTFDFHENKMGVILSEKQPPRPHSSFVDSDWAFRASAIKSRGGPFYMSGKRAQENKLALFAGICKHCGGTDIIFGSWTFIRPPKDCQDIQMMIETKRDIFRRNVINSEANKSL